MIVLKSSHWGWWLWDCLQTALTVDWAGKALQPQYKGIIKSLQTIDLFEPNVHLSPWLRHIWFLLQPPDLEPLARPFRT